MHITNPSANRYMMTQSFCFIHHKATYSSSFSNGSTFVSICSARIKLTSKQSHFNLSLDHFALSCSTFCLFELTTADAAALCQAQAKDVPWVLSSSRQEVASWNVPSAFTSCMELGFIYWTQIQMQCFCFCSLFHRFKWKIYNFCMHSIRYISPANPH